MTADTDGTSARTILVVEDEASLASALSYNLRKAGYTVVEARDGAAALREGAAGRRPAPAPARPIHTTASGRI